MTDKPYDFTQEQVKSLSTEDFEYIFQDTKINQFKTKPMKHQYAATTWSLGKREVMYLMGIGTGKTYSAILTSQFWNSKKTLIVCPNSVRQTWKDEITKHTKKTYTELYGSAKEREKLFSSTNTDFYIINYEGLKILWGKRIPLRTKTKTGKSSTKWVVDNDSIVKSGFDCLIVDEIHHCRNFKATQTLIAYEIANVAKQVIGLTGTPFDKELTDFWGEFMVLDGGETLGNNWWKFLSAYFKPYQIPVGRGMKITRYSIRPDKKDELLDKIGQKVLRYETAECTDLPKVTYQTRYVWMSSDQEDAYNRILNDLIVDLNNGELTLSNVMNKSIKLRQVVSGFILNEEKKPVWFKKNPKLDELENLLYETGNSKVVIFHHFVEEGRIIEQMLRKAKIKFVSMRGEIKDKQKEYIKFRDNPDVKIMVAHPISGGEGLNLQVANIIIFFSQIGGGGISRPQAEGRIIRAGQDKPCVIIDLICGSGHQYETVEERLSRASRQNVNFSESVLDWLKNWRQI